MINDTVKILELVEERNNKLTDESISYSGERSYFDAGRIINKNIDFTITYKKSVKELGYQAESNHYIGTTILKKVFAENKDLLIKEVALKLSLDEADRNPNWYRLRTNIILNNNDDIIEQVDKIVLSFDKFRKILRKLVNEIDINEIKELSKIEGSKDRKMSTDSWVDNIEVNNNKFLGRKTVDYSMLNYGTIIPIRYYNKFLENLSTNLEVGSSVKITMILNGIKYPGSIDMPNSKNRKTPPVRINYRNKLLKETLQKEFQSSYDYILDYEKKNDKKPNTIPDEYKEYIDFYKGDKLDTFIMELLPIKAQATIEEGNKEIDVDDEDITSEDIEINNEFWDVTNVKEEIEYIHSYITKKGFEYSKELIENLYLSIKTKPFVILSGISGTGKSKIVQLFAEAIGANYDNGRFKLIPIKPDWSDATDLLGYRNIEGKFTPGIITLAAYEAMKNPENPYFICLDEMNLARVEYYFSDILSLMETKRLDSNGNIVTEKLISKEQFGRDTASFDKYGDVYIPQNLYIIGTVNMDETTFQFSKKVLDRANTIEFNKVDLSYNFEQIFNEEIEGRIYHNDFLKANYLKISECKNEKEIAIRVIDKLISINNILENYNQHFGFRVRDEIVFYMIYATKNNIMDFDKALDYCIVQKILPKINGSNSDVLEILVKIFNLFNKSNFNCENYLDDISIKEMIKKSKESDYKLSSEKLMYMIRRFVKDGFTSFWQ